MKRYILIIELLIDEEMINVWNIWRESNEEIEDWDWIKNARSVCERRERKKVIRIIIFGFIRMKDKDYNNWY